MLPQALPTTPPHCSANWTEVTSTSDSLLVRFSSSGVQPCNFSLLVTEGSEVRSAFCQQDGESTSEFVCHLKHLQPGTLYLLTVIPRGGGERKNMSARTGEVTVEISASGERCEHTL